MPNNEEHNFSVPSNSSVPDGWEMIHRSAIVRLGPDYGIHYPDHHGVLGVLDVSVDDGYLVVHTDFGDDEVILTATANVDLTLAAKGVFAGASGGTSSTKFGIYSAKKLYTNNGQGTASYAAFTILPPHSSVFNSSLDNLWLNWKSLRPLV